MKCPHCYCNYDDSERSCPMCGTRSTVAACQNTKHKSVVYPNGRQAQPAQRQARGAVHPAGNAAPRRTSTSPRTASQTRTTTQTRTTAQTRSTYNRSGRQDPAAAAQKRRRKAWIAVIAAVVLINLLPMLTYAVGDLFYSVRSELEYRDNGFHFFDEDAPAPDYPDDYTAEPDHPEWDGDTETVDGIVAGGDYYCEDTGLYFTFDFSDMTYWLSVNGYLEYGSFLTLANDPTVDADYFNDEFSAEEFDSYVLYLRPDFEREEEDREEYTLAVMYVPRGETPGRFYLNNTYADAQWLPLDRAVLLEHW